MIVNFICVRRNAGLKHDLISPEQESLRIERSQVILAEAEAVLIVNEANDG